MDKSMSVCKVEWDFQWVKVNRMLQILQQMHCLMS